MIAGSDPDKFLFSGLGRPWGQVLHSNILADSDPSKLLFLQIILLHLKTRGDVHILFYLTDQFCDNLIDIHAVTNGIDNDGFVVIINFIYCPVSFYF